MSDLLDPIEAMAEEMLLQGDGVPDRAGVTCELCGWEAELPWALRERLDGLAEEHAQTAHPDGPDDEDEDEDDED